MADAGRRRGYLDWLRGVAVLIMIQAHVIDSWTAEPFRQTREFGRAMILGGFGAPLFLFLAGVSVALSAASKARKARDARVASRAVVRRGLEVFGLAFLFRLQSWLLSGGPARSLLRVDVLNIMGPSIATAALIWGAVKTTRGKCLAFGGAAVAASLLTPPVRSASWLAPIPDPIEGYIRPIAGLTNFVLFPWAGFVFAGALVGVLVEASRTRESEQRLMAGLAIAGGSLVAIAFAGSYLPSLYPRSSFWTSSPSYFAIRVGLLTLAVPAAFAWERRMATAGWSPVRQLGRTSLFIYWIHVEMVYGILSSDLHRALTFRQAWLAWAAFAFLMLCLSLAKDRIVTLVRNRPSERLK